MKKIGVAFFVMYLYSHFALAVCLVADAQWKAGEYEQAMVNYENCAYKKNDAIAQYTLANFYLDGNDYIKQDIRHALFFLRLSAENGYAPAQRMLALLIDDLENLGEVGEKGLNDWKQQMKRLGFSDIPAFSWLLLAADKQENKWFYPTPGDVDEEAIRLADSWTNKRGSDEKGLATQMAVAWKQIRLIKSAKVLLNPVEFESFLKIMETKETGSDIRNRKKRAMDRVKQVWEVKKNL